MQRSTALMLILGLGVATGLDVASDDQAHANPIRKVVNMLQAMQKKISAEGEKETELFDKFMCYCKSGGTTLSASISAAEAKVPAVGSDIEESEAQVKQDKEDLKKAQTDRAAAKAAMAEAAAIRAKEAAAFAAEKAELSANIDAMTKSTSAIENGMTGFLQTSTAKQLRQLVIDNKEVADYTDRKLFPSSLANRLASTPQRAVKLQVF